MYIYDSDMRGSSSVSKLLWKGLRFYASWKATETEKAMNDGWGSVHKLERKGGCLVSSDKVFGETVMAANRLA